VKVKVERPIAACQAQVMILKALAYSGRGDLFSEAVTARMEFTKKWFLD
jgi:hypothetical protein